MALEQFITFIMQMNLVNNYLITSVNKSIIILNDNELSNHKRRSTSSSIHRLVT